MPNEEIEEKKIILENSVGNEDENYSLEGDTGLKQALGITKEFYNIVKKYLILLSLPVIIMALYGYYKGKKVLPTYTSVLTFFLSEDRPQIPGVNILQTTNTNFNNPKKLKEYAFTQKVGSKMLFNKCVFQGKEDYLANHYLKIYNGLDYSYFKDFTSVKEMSIPDYLIFTKMLAGIRKMVTVDYNEAEIYSITVTAGNEEFTKLLCELFYQNLIDYYIERATKKTKITVFFLEEKLAYVKAQLENSEYNLADYKDKSNNIVTYKADLIETRYIRNKALLESLYGQTAVALESAKSNDASITPLFQTIDEPHFPLQINIVSTKKQLITYIFMGLAIDILLVIAIFVRINYWKQFKELVKSA